MDKMIPGPSGHWLWGSLPQFREDMLEFLTDMRESYGTIARFRLGPRSLVLVSDPSLIEEVLVTKNRCFRKHYAVRLLRPVLGNGLLLSEGATWLRQRRLIQPAFNRRFETAFADLVRRHTLELAEQWQRAPRRDLYQDMTQLTVRIAADAFLGVAHPGEADVIGECLEVIHGDYEHRFQQPWNWPLWLPSQRNRRLLAAVRELTRIIDRMISDRQADAGDRGDALSRLLVAQRRAATQMPRQLLRDEVMTLLLAGHDTTANGLTWTWTLLARHPAVLQAIQREADRLEPATTEQSDTVDDAGRLAVTTQVVKESLRILPPVYLFGREATTSCELGEYRIRKGESVIMSQWVVHRDRRLFDDPESFVPSRWTPQFEQSLPRYAYFPFGGGPRVCIGKDLAMTEAKLILATLASRFSVTLDEPQTLELWPTVTLRPRNAVWGIARSRTDQPVARVR